MTPPKRTPLMFPVLVQSAMVSRAEMRAWPRHVPWATVEPWRARLERNHGWSLEQIAKSSGLTPVELWLGAHDLELGRFTDVTETEAAKWLIAELTKGTV